MERKNLKNKGVMSKTKILTYIVFTICFIATSFFSLLFIYNLFSDKSSFLTLKIFPQGVIVKLFLLTILYFLLSSIRFYYILKTLKIDMNFIYIVKLTFINMFITNVTPFAVGGGLAQIYFLNKEGISLGDAIAASTIRGFIPIIFFFICAPVILLQNRMLLRIPPKEDNLYYILVLLFLYGLIVYGFYRVIKNKIIILKIVDKVLNLLEGKKVLSRTKSDNIKSKLFEEIDRFTMSINRFLGGDKKYIFLSLLYSMLFLVSLFMFTVILINGLGNNISPIKIITMQIVVTFITYLAPTPGATGAAEGGFTLVFSKYISKSHIVPIVFSWRFFTIYIGMAMGGIFFYLEVIKNRTRDKKS